MTEKDPRSSFIGWKGIFFPVPEFLCEIPFNHFLIGV